MGKEINELLQKKAYFYVCGDAANMAREVNTVLAQILAEQRGIPESKAEDIVKGMRASNQYQVRLAVRVEGLPAAAQRTPAFPVASGTFPVRYNKQVLTWLIGGCLVMSNGTGHETIGQRSYRRTRESICMHG